MQETDRLLTEQGNPRSAKFDSMTTADMLRVMNEEDRGVPEAVGRCLPVIAQAVDRIADALAGGGRLFYVGAGTSGRLGVLDAYECPPTFGTPPELVQALLAGGLHKTEADESAEDDAEQGAAELAERGVRAGDVVVGIAASGRTPYVLGALACAADAGAATIAVSCNAGSPLGRAAELAIEVEVGPEVLTGSTRLKAGTAQKLVLNMLSTAAMAKLGKVYRNLMVDMQASNGKLYERARRMVAMATGAGDEEVQTAMAASGGHVKTAIVLLLAGVSADEARARLAAADGRVREALQASL
ncbi:N-acetylmuramic acid 6-phosphate etherase [Paenibacillus sp. J31TS4]|uniref:N-acetylmuramic acid 6-phosphate etherase n=1 Tax=Paenibacillus sp. J31TS4 TaxID=2807195 RepID=UPI001B05E414|nr:N-acetylmuramic acid 6-phosphate etherase [Paenibacillus sp. J31TS4]GIP38997.1 N-acetylmuramic acid 6-phosphate etherase [Paenibacillus sp. J31TS4]